MASVLVLSLGQSGLWEALETPQFVPHAMEALCRREILRAKLARSSIEWTTLQNLVSVPDDDPEPLRWIETYSALICIAQVVVSESGRLLPVRRLLDTIHSLKSQINCCTRQLKNAIKHPHLASMVAYATMALKSCMSHLDMTRTRRQSTRECVEQVAITAARSLIGLLDPSVAPNLEQSTIYSVCAAVSLSVRYVSLSPEALAALLRISADTAPVSKLGALMCIRVVSQCELRRILVANRYSDRAVSSSTQERKWQKFCCELIRSGGALLFLACASDESASAAVRETAAECFSLMCEASSPPVLDSTLDQLLPLLDLQSDSVCSWVAASIWALGRTPDNRKRLVLRGAVPALMRLGERMIKTDTVGMRWVMSAVRILCYDVQGVECFLNSPFALAKLLHWSQPLSTWDNVYEASPACMDTPLVLACLATMHLCLRTSRGVEMAEEMSLDFGILRLCCGILASPVQIKSPPMIVKRVKKARARAIPTAVLREAAGIFCALQEARCHTTQLIVKKIAGSLHAVEDLLCYQLLRRHTVDSSGRSSTSNSVALLHASCAQALASLACVRSRRDWLCKNGSIKALGDVLLLENSNSVMSVASCLANISASPKSHTEMVRHALRGLEMAAQRDNRKNKTPEGLSPVLHVLSNLSRSAQGQVRRAVYRVFLRLVGGSNGPLLDRQKALRTLPVYFWGAQQAQVIHEVDRALADITEGKEDLLIGQLSAPASSTQSFHAASGALDPWKPPIHFDPHLTSTDEMGAGKNLQTLDDGEGCIAEVGSNEKVDEENSFLQNAYCASIERRRPATSPCVHSRLITAPELNTAAFVFGSNSKFWRSQHNKEETLFRFPHIQGSRICCTAGGDVFASPSGEEYHFSLGGVDVLAYAPTAPYAYPKTSLPISRRELCVPLPFQGERAESTAQAPVSFLANDGSEFGSPLDLPAPSAPRSLGPHMHHLPCAASACCRTRGIEPLSSECPAGPESCPFWGSFPVELQGFCVDPPLQRSDFDLRETGEKVDVWTLEKSIYLPRRKGVNNPGRSFYENISLHRKKFSVEWGRIRRLDRFKRFLGQGCRQRRVESTLADGVQFESMAEELEVVVWKAFPIIISSYTFYISLGGHGGEPYGSAYQMGRDQYIQFLEDIAAITPSSSEFQELVRIFIAVNVEEDAGSDHATAAAENENNMDQFLVLHEWIELWLRVAFSLFPGVPVKDAFEMLKDQGAKQLPRLALVDPDDFRRQFLYTCDVERVLSKWLSGLKALWKTYPMNNVRRKERKKGGAGGGTLKSFLRFSLTDWDHLLIDCKVYDIWDREFCKLCFLHSRMAKVDELLDRDRSGTLSFIDFMEAVSRIALGPRPHCRNAAAASSVVNSFLKRLFTQLHRHHDGQLKVRFPGNSEDGRVALDIEALLFSMNESK